MTEDYRRELFKVHDEWAGELARRLAEMTGDKGALMAEVDKALPDLLADLKARGERRIRHAYLVGMRGHEPSERALKGIKAQIAKNDKYLESSFIPYVREKLEKGIAEGTKPQVFAAGITPQLILDALSPTRSRIGMYAGEVWNAVWLGAKVFGQDQDEEARAKGEKTRRVRWVLGDGNPHCEDCLRYQGEYDSWDALPTVPGGDCACKTNCTCSIEVMEEDGEWVSVA
jgi:hypothetical protein